VQKKRLETIIKSRGNNNSQSSMRYINYVDSFLGRLSEQDNEYLVECVASFNENEGGTTGGD